MVRAMEARPKARRSTGPGAEERGIIVSYDSSTEGRPRQAIKDFQCSEEPAGALRAPCFAWGRILGWRNQCTSKPRERKYSRTLSVASGVGGFVSSNSYFSPKECHLSRPI